MQRERVLGIVACASLTGLIIQPLAEVHRLYKHGFEATIVGGRLWRAQGAGTTQPLATCPGVVPHAWRGHALMALARPRDAPSFAQRGLEATGGSGDVSRHWERRLVE